MVMENKKIGPTRTGKMNMARPAFIGSKAQLFWPGPPNAGSGTVITDIVNGATITDASAVWTTAQAFDFLQADTVDSGITAGMVGGQANDTGSTAYLLAICFGVVTSSAFGVISLQDNGGITQSISISGGSGFAINDTTASQTAALYNTPTASGTMVLAGSYVPSTGAVASYDGVDGGAVSQVNTATAAAARIAAGFRFADTTKLACGSFTRQNIYGIIMLRFYDGLPSTTEADLTEIGVNWPMGHKVLPTSWL